MRWVARAISNHHEGYLPQQQRIVIANTEQEAKQAAAEMFDLAPWQVEVEAIE